MNNTKKSEAESRFEPVAIESSACQQRLNADAEILLARRNREHMNLVRKSFTSFLILLSSSTTNIFALSIFFSPNLYLGVPDYFYI